MAATQSDPIFKQTFQSMKGLSNDLSLGYKVLERWVHEEKMKGFDEFFIEGTKYSVIPGRIKIPGVRTYIWNCQIFYTYYFLPKINGVTKPELVNGELVFVTINNPKEGVNKYVS